MRVDRARAPARAPRPSEHCAVAPGADELPQLGLAVELLHMGERRTLDRSVQAALVDASRRSGDPPLRNALRPMIVSVNSATHCSASSRAFQTSASRPPGRSTRAISGSAGPWSNQWNACAHVTTSAEPSGSGIDSALPITASASGTAARSCASISASGSTAVTRCPRATSERVSFPVPAPRSTTSHGRLAGEPADRVVRIPGPCPLVRRRPRRERRGSLQPRRRDPRPSPERILGRCVAQRSSPRPRGARGRRLRWRLVGRRAGVRRRRPARRPRGRSRDPRRGRRAGHLVHER